MTRVCLVGDADVTLHYELLSRETSREALSTYELERPFENTLAVRTVSLGAAISLCNDLQWYIVRFVDDVLIQEPSVSETEWLSRPLAEALRVGEIERAETGEYLKIYGVEQPTTESESGPGRTTDPRDGTGEGRAASDPGEDTHPSSSGDAEHDGAPDSEVTDRPGTLVEPLYVRRTDGSVPSYDLRDVTETVVVRLTEAEYSP